MRTLFDIMDDKRTGYVRLTDIENRWRDDRTRGLPQGVVESLQKVASHDGLLTFDRFCTGLKICLLRNQVDSKTDTLSDGIVKSHTTLVQSRRPPSAPVLDINETHIDRNWGSVNVSANMTQHRTISMPLLIAQKEAQVQDIHRTMVPQPPSKPDALNGIYSQGPPKPPRMEKPLPERKELSRSISKSEDDTFDSEHMDDTKHEIIRAGENHSRGLGDGRPNSESLQLQMAVRRVRRREPRRHTLHNGVDYNLLKRMKQIEQEKDLLLQGLASIEEAREWYLKQLSEVQEKMRYAGRMGAYVVRALNFYEALIITGSAGVRRFA